eukprot:15045881-Ditylum_brightwellii.AAC.1
MCVGLVGGLVVGLPCLLADAPVPRLCSVLPPRLRSTWSSCPSCHSNFILLGFCPTGVPIPSPTLALIP